MFFFSELFTLADYYEEEDLKGLCEQQLKVLVTPNNVSEVYSAAVELSSKVASSNYVCSVGKFPGWYSVKLEINDFPFEHRLCMPM